MSERLRTVEFMAAAAAGAVLLAGCSISLEKYPDEAALERCYDHPQPAPDPAADIGKIPEPPKLSSYDRRPGESSSRYIHRINSAEKKWQRQFKQHNEAFDQVYDPDPVVVHMHDGLPEGRFMPRDETTTRVGKAIVEITTDDWKGTGFVVGTKKSQRVVTAAHVMSTAKLDQLTFTTADGRHVHATGGCYMYESAGKFAGVPNANETEEGGVEDIDVAVFTLPRPIVKKPLTLAAETPKSGDRVDFVNYQSDYGPRKSLYPGNLIEQPATFTGIVTPPDAFSQNMSVITGIYDLESHPTVADFASNHLVPGGSGGPVVDGHGAVIGESFAATKDSLYLDKEELQESDHIIFKGVKITGDSGFQPTEAFVVPSKYIDKALHSEALHQSSGN